MNLQRARYLVAIADHLNFTRAAAELHVAQSALSQQIKVLERELGVILFDRRGPRISLTAPGIVAVREATFLLESADRAVERIRAAALGSEGELRIVHTRSWAGGAVALAVNQFRSKYPRIAITEHRGYTTRNTALATDGTVDIAVVRPPVDQPELTVRILDQERLLLAVPSGHPFSALDAVDRAQLADEQVVFWPRANGPGMYDAIVEIFWPTTAPNVVRREADDEQVLHAVAAGVGVAPMPAGRAATYRVPGVHMCEIEGPPQYLPVGVAFRADNSNLALRLFLDVVDQVVDTSLLVR
ncbi:LysR family transcriptional regulator [Rhodococcus sp. NPDC056743]|uniref:LysR family transcriptional regulator n=1 Tax=Rhodococcus sp. NPDC056743 TaxID=3345934 RepID=UPI00366ACCAB